MAIKYYKHCHAKVHQKALTPIFWIKSFLYIFEIQSIVKKTLGLDQLVERLTSQLGDLKQALLVGDYAKGIDSGLIDIVLIGEVDKEYLDKLVTKTETLIHRKIRALVLTEEELRKMKETKWKDENLLLVWSSKQHDY